MRSMYSIEGLGRVYIMPYSFSNFFYLLVFYHPFLSQHPVKLFGCEKNGTVLCAVWRVREWCEGGGGCEKYGTGLCAGWRVSEGCCGRGALGVERGGR